MRDKNITQIRREIETENDPVNSLCSKTIKLQSDKFFS